MSDEKTALSTPPPVSTAVSATAVPSYLQDLKGETGQEMLGKFVVPPRLKISQKASASDFTKEFPVGSLVLMPTRTLLAAPGEAIAFAPIFFFAEWCSWNPIELKGTVPALAYRTTDPSDSLVAKCRNKAGREEPYPTLHNGKQVFIKNKEHLNYICKILSGPYAGLYTLIPFYGAQHQDGTNFANLISMRSTKFLVANNFELRTYEKAWGGNDWFGIQVTNPTTVTPYCDEAEFNTRREQFEQLKAAHAMGSMTPEYDDEEPSAKAGSVDGAVLNGGSVQPGATF